MIKLTNDLLLIMKVHVDDQPEKVDAVPTDQKTPVAKPEGNELL